MAVRRNSTSFTKLNDGWNADGGAPHPEIKIDGSTLVLTFYLNWGFQNVKAGDCGELRFFDCWRYTLGETNDEGWWRRQCRFSLLAPDRGEFYEVSGDLGLDRLPAKSWVLLADPAPSGSRHFLFYFKDETFECDASDWHFKTLPAVGDVTATWGKISLSSGSSIHIVPPRSSVSVVVEPIAPRTLESRVQQFFHKWLSR